jgi:hypothetical protein
MGHMQHMGGPPMGGPPMGAQQMPRPAKRGTSKAVPVVVSAGLAVGVFCGLLFGVGTGKQEAEANAPSASNVKKEEETSAAPEGLGASKAAPVPATPTTPTTPATGSAAPPVAATGSAAAPTTPSVPEKKLMKLTIKIKPDAAAKDAKIMVDGTTIEGVATDVPLDKKTVKVEVKSSGYRSAEKKLDVSEGEMTLEIELSKRSSSGGGGVRPPKRPDRPPSGGGGGLIDI